MLVHVYFLHGEYMKKKYLLIPLLILLIVFVGVFAGCNKSHYEKSLINGYSDSQVFGYKTLDDAKKEWRLKTSSGEETNVFSFAENGLTINVDGGYAYAYQKVKLATNAYYKVTYEYSIKSQLRGAGANPLYYDGLFVGFEEDLNFNTRNEKKTQHKNLSTNEKSTFYFKSDDSRVYNLKVALGTVDGPTNGTATLNKLVLVRVKETEAKEKGEVFGLYNLKTTVFGKASTNNIIYIVLGSLFIPILGYVVYRLRSRDLAFEKKDSSNKIYNKLKENKFVAPAVLVGITLLIRTLILLVQSLQASDKTIIETLFGFNLEQLSSFGQWIAKHGTPYFIDKNPASTFLPAPLYLSALAGLIGNAASAPTSGELITVSLIKAFAIIADVGTVLIIYSMISKRQGRTAALIMSIGYSLMPAIFLSSSVGWGIVQSLSIFTLVLTSYFIIEKKYIGAAISYFIACMTSVSALLFVPAVLIYSIMVVVMGIRDKNVKSWLPPIVLTVLGIFMFYIITLPFTIKFVQNSNPMYAFNYFIKIVEGRNLYTLNAFNFQGLLKNNFTAVTTQSTLVTILFMLFLVLILVIIYIKNKNRLQLMALAGAFALMSWTFLNNMVPEALLTILPILYIVTCLYKDKRLYIVFLLYALLAFINISYVHLIVGYGAEIFEIKYTETPILYVMGSFSLIFMIYYIAVLYDIIISKKVLPQRTIEVTYFKHLKYSMKNMQSIAKKASSKIKMFFYILSEERKQSKLEKKTNKIQEAEVDNTNIKAEASKENAKQSKDKKKGNLQKEESEDKAYKE